MATNNIMAKHSKEMIEFKALQKKEWSSLLKEQEARLVNESNVVGLAEQFAREREDHNKKFEKEKKDLLQRQQKELEELKKLKENNRSNDEIER